MAATTNHDQLLALTPTPGRAPDWEQIEALWPGRFEAMADCMQDPTHHGEGDVLTHTKIVVSELVASPDWARLPADRRAGLFWAAVLHDIGKPATTREEDGRLTSRGHSRVGASIARELLWAAAAPFAWREEICGIITAHQLPFWLIERENAARMAIETSWLCNSADLITHARADARGRICADLEDILERVALAQLLFEEERCLGVARSFANDDSRVIWAHRSDRDPDYAAHEDFSCEVTMMSGLPGSGKDTWLARNAADLPVISLDEIRIEMGVDPAGNQGQVVQEARERARVHLRAGRDFAWNATNITRNMREPLLALFRDYGARTRIVYVEAARDQLGAQNRNREAVVPEKVIERLIGKLEPPRRLEAHEVVYATP